MEKLDLSPKKAEDFRISDLINFTDMLIAAGATHNMVQSMAIYKNREEQAKARRMVKAWNDQNPLGIFTDVKRQWEMIYEEYSNHSATGKPDFSKIVLPEYYQHERIIIVEENFTIYAAIEACRKYFGKIEFQSHDIKSLSNVRRPYRLPYGLIVKNIVNACEDGKLKRKSYNDLKKDEGHNGITLMERLLLELHYFITTGKHLDNTDYSSTICTGSYFNGSGVPVVKCRNGIVEIGCIPPDVVIEGNNDCAREVVVF